MLCCLCFALDAAQAQQKTGKRMALVIGNDAYQHVSKLHKAGNDATAMARELKEAGFEVQLHRDLNYRSMIKAVENFAGRIGGGDQVVVFFAGHGVQIKAGSYLLPVDIEAGSESEVEKTAYGLNDLTERLAEAKAGFSLVLVDACRDNPLKSYGRGVGASRGLSAIEPPKGQMVVYSASRGQQALDRLNDRDANPNGVFTREFIARMRRPGARVEDLVREVQDAVETLARSVNHDQRPAIYNEARGNFYFFGPTTVQVTPGADNRARARTPEEIEDGYRDGIKDSSDSAAFNAYLKAYPKGRYAALARNALRKLESQPAGAKPANQDTAESNAWQRAEQAGTVDAYAAYLAAYPNGQYKALAQMRVAKLDNNDPAQQEAQLRNAAERGDSAAMVALGDRSASDADAKDWYRKAAAKGNFVAAFKLSGHAKGRTSVDVAAVERMLELPAGPERTININGHDAVRAFVASDPFFQVASSGQEKVAYSYMDPKGIKIGKTCAREGNLFATKLDYSNESSVAEGHSVLGGLIALDTRSSVRGYLGSVSAKITSVEKVYGQAFPLTRGSRFGMTYTITRQDGVGRIFGEDTIYSKWHVTCGVAEAESKAAGQSQVPAGAQQVVCYTTSNSQTLWQAVRRLYWHEASGCLVDTQ